MVEIFIYQDDESNYRALTVSGHAGFSDPEHGGDIVCAAVSALVGYLGLAFSDVVPEAAGVDASDGLFRLDVLRACPELHILLRTFVLAVKQLEENYKGWVKVEERKWTQESS